MGAAKKSELYSDEGKVSVLRATLPSKDACLTSLTAMSKWTIFFPRGGRLTYSIKGSTRAPVPVSPNALVVADGSGSFYAFTDDLKGPVEIEFHGTAVMEGVLVDCSAAYATRVRLFGDVLGCVVSLLIYDGTAMRSDVYKLGRDGRDVVLSRTLKDDRYVSPLAPFDRVRVLRACYVACEAAGKVAGVVVELDEDLEASLFGPPFPAMDFTFPSSPFFEIPAFLTQPMPSDAREQRASAPANEAYVPDEMLEAILSELP